MTRRGFLGAATATAAAFAQPANKRPNVLFIAVDDLRPELGCYGAGHVRSPRIDELARTGTIFTRAYCQQALCNPSRASLMTGLRPDTLRVWNLQTNFRTTRPEAVTIPQAFRAGGGYYAACIGKIFHNIFPDDVSWSEPEMHIDGFPFDPDAVYRSEEEVRWLERRKEEIRAQGNEKRFIDRYGQWYLKSSATEIADVPDDAYYDGAQTTAAIAKIRELYRRGQPFFFGIGYYRPHLPFNAPKKYWDLYEREKIPLAANAFLPRGAPPMAHNMNRELRGYRDFANAPKPHEGSVSQVEARRLRHGYLASVSYIDAQVGRLLDELAALGIAENTIVVLWGDHGWKLGEHNSWGKMTNYEVDTRVPLIVRAPGMKRGGRAAGMVEFVDVFPSLCELAAIAAPTGLEGQSFVGQLRDPAKKGKAAVFSQYLRDGIWVAPDGKPYMGYAVRTERHRYVEWYTWPERKRVAAELYDLRRDPLENEGIAGTAQLRARLAALLRRQFGLALA
ncbi:MAG: sulfatase [Bryobacteraceae bacterium]|nr:sulfatase [Bryobacteraceae bacterium]